VCPVPKLSNLVILNLFYIYVVGLCCLDFSAFHLSSDRIKTIMEPFRNNDIQWP
jgi:hypothetical protein